MMKNIYFGLMLTAGLVLTACSSDDSNTEQVYRTYTMTIDATKGANEAAVHANTRALTLTGSTLNASWATTEQVYVQGKLVGGDYFWFEGSIQPQSAGTTTRLNGTISLPTGWTYSSIDEAIGTPHKVNLQFPRPYLLDYTGQIGTLLDIAAKYDYARAEEVQVDIKADKVLGTSPVTFVNQQAIVKFTLKQSDGTTLLNPTALTIQYGEESLSLTSIPDATYTTNGNGVLYVAIPGFSEQDVTLTATCTNGTYSYTKSKITFVNGKYYEITVKMKK
ncbi:MAG: hypothetical protein J5720_03200 [Bacteroidaceae bacterium]|nr:hypothetical protein [Bacteroidaceae bacterium]